MRKGPKPPERDRGPRSDLELTYGLRAGLALCARRPDDVTRIGWSGSVAREVEPVATELRRRGAHAAVLSDRELEQIARSPQHEGLCVESRPRRWAGPSEVADLLAARRGVAIALDRVRNSYNIGAILRVAAFFGVDAAILGAPAPHPALDPNAIRVAEGGAESLVLSRTTDLADTLGRLRARGVSIVGADGASTTDALDHRFVRPSVLVVGNEREGLGPRVRAQCDAVVAIRGSGAIESLNVAVAAGVLVAALVRRPS